MDQSNSLSSMSNNFSNDIITEILSWLPVVSLLRFKSVSKFWFNLIISPRFIKLHQDHHHLTTTATQNNKVDPIVLFMSKNHYSLRSLEKIVSLSSSSPICYEEIEKINYPFNSRKYLYEIIGTGNGLICIHITPDPKHVQVEKEMFSLWNPSTKEFKVLPFAVGVLLHVKNITVRYGFGYDNVTNDYKIIWSVQVFGRVKHRTYLKVYTVGTNSQRKIEGTYYECEWYIRNASNWLYVNGAFHRIAQITTECFRILSFDIVEEVYLEVPKPDCRLEGCYEWKLTVLRGCLCLWASLGSYTIEMWMMMDYGVKESWTRLFRTQDVYSYFVKPVWFCCNGEVVMVNGLSREVIIYDTERNESKLLMGPSSQKSDFVSEIYIGSLVSPRTTE